ncbi:alanine racemase [Dactylosporangium fulvum]|uniref:Alanine racemase n=1 Tax=Dactylosporangium fulvum TaxID=53359 RepID=A0ABY5VT63_9ACTN|nr:alanine racemase [Dactylosporangium fulvum]UWP80301.1 alanine racemase [Dactylosporangium fulvum]
MSSEIATPALIVHADIARRNVATYASLAKEHGVSLRPHAKTHRSEVLAGWQRDAGAQGLTVATYQEAEYFVGAGHRDVFIACPPVGAARQRVLASLVREADVVVSADSVDVVAAIDDVGRAAGRPVRYYWEVDAGFARFGSGAGEATAAELLNAQRYPHATFAGLMAFNGRSYTVEDARDVARVSRAETELVLLTAEMLRTAGLEVPVVSVGSTPSAATVAAIPGITEIRPGTYIFNDATQVALGAATLADCAQTICATVMSAPADGRIVIDAGSKALPKEIMNRLTVGYGTVLGYPGLVIERVTEEASVLVWSTPDHVEPPRLGDQIQIVSNHCCPATYLYSHFLLIDGGDVERLPVNARTR